jgi:hypothetical protein
MPAFGQGLVWAAIWVRWMVLAARAAVMRDARVST